MQITTTKKLNNGVEIPCFGLGVFKAKNGGETRQSVEWALAAGYRHIDTAAIYGNEEDVGQGIKNSGVPRNEIFLTTKLWNENMRQGSQMQGFEESLKRLGADYVDLYLIHWPVPGKYKESWKVMEEIYASGRAKAIGISNFLQHHVEDLMQNAKVTPAVNQLELHPRNSIYPLQRFCEGLGIAVEAWSPLGGTGGNLLSDATLAAVGGKYGKSPAQIILRWNLQRGIITIPKSVHQERIIQNTEIFDFELSAEDMKVIDGLNQDKRVGADPDNFNF